MHNKITIRYYNDIKLTFDKPGYLDNIINNKIRDDYN